MPITQKNVLGGNGIPYTYEADGPGDHGLIPNNTYFKDLTDSLIYYKNSLGDVVGLFTTGIDSVDHGEVYYVSPEGNDASGSAGNINKPYLTLEGARDAATAHRRRRFTVYGVAQADITIDGTPHTSNLGTAALNAAALAASIGVNATYVAATDYFEVEIAPTFTASGLTANIYTSIFVTIHVFPGVYAVTTTDVSGLCVSGVSWYFAPGTTVTKATANPLFSLDGLYHVSNVLGYADITVSTTAFYAFNSAASNLEWVIEINSCTGNALVGSSNTGTKTYLTARKSLISSGNVAAATNAGHYFIKCPYIQGSVAGYGANTGVLTCAGGGGTSCHIEADVITNTLAGYSFQSYSSTSVYIKARTTGVILTSSPSVLDIAICSSLESGDSTKFNGYATSVAFSGGDLSVGRFTNLTGTASTGHFTGLFENGNIAISGGTPTNLSKAHYDIWGNGTYSGSGNTVTVSNSSYLNLLGSWHVYGSVTVSNGGVVNLKGDYRPYGPLNGSPSINVNAGGKLILEGTARLGPENGISGSVIGINGGDVICNGGTVITPELGYRPIVAVAAPRDLKVYGGGLVSNNLYMLDNTKGIDAYSVIAAGVATSLTINGDLYSEADTVTYNTTALMATRLISLINAGSPNLNQYRAAPYGSYTGYVVIIYTGAGVTVPVNLAFSASAPSSFALNQTINAGNIVLDTNVV